MTAKNEKPFEEQDILEKLKLRSEIRRKIGRTKDGKPDRISDTCDEAAGTIERLRQRIIDLEDECRAQRAHVIDLQERINKITRKTGEW
jgi:hypothetical protein